MLNGTPFYCPPRKILSVLSFIVSMRFRTHFILYSQLLIEFELFLSSTSLYQVESKRISLEMQLKQLEMAVKKFPVQDAIEPHMESRWYTL